MMILRKRWLICLCVLVLALLAAALLQPLSVTVFSPETSNEPIVILDAGHGGADGGAVSPDGILESEINLAMTKRLALLMIFCGQRVALTRVDDNDLSAQDAQSIREQKKSDLANRVAAINSIPNATLISIHQNSLAGNQSVHGAQVFYNTVSGSDQLANMVQQKLNQHHNSKDRLSKKIDNSIYLMQQTKCPAILVECGFLSNPQEAHALCTPEFQKQIVLAIAAGYFSYTNGEMT